MRLPMFSKGRPGWKNVIPKFHELCGPSLSSV